jgi:DNA-binding IclR family transcriptional regulator
VSSDSRVTRISKLLNALATGYDCDRRVMRLVDLSNVSGIPLTTTYRLVTELSAYRIVERDTDGYRLGSRLFELGERALPESRVRDTALPYLADLARLTDSATHMAVLDGDDVLFIAKVAKWEDALLQTAVGGRIPAIAPALGRVLLAHQRPHAGPSMKGLDLGSGRVPSVARLDCGELRRSLADIRARGYATDRGQTAAGVGCVAMAIKVAGEAVAAVSCSVKLADLQPERYVPLLRSITVAISRSLSVPENARTRTCRN